VYRIHSEGVWSSANNYERKLQYFYALDAALSKIPQLSNYDHLFTWRKWNLTQAFYLLADQFSFKYFKKFSYMLLKILKYQDANEKRKALKKYFKTISILYGI
jgi:hypothetical protein